MRRKLLAVMILVCCLCVRAEAAEWTSYFKIDWDSVGDYFSEKWEAVSNYFKGSDEESAPVSDDNLPQNLASDWTKLTETLNDTLALRDKQETLPNKTWIPFTEDKVSNGKKINALLDRAVRILTNGEAGDIRQKAAELRDKIAAQKLELDSLRNKRITAPEESKNPFTLTKSKADKKIAELQREITTNEEALRNVTAELSGALMKLGLTLTQSQTDILLNSVTGDDITQNVIVFDNVKAVVEKLEELAQNDTNTLEITKRYTGLYLVLNDLLIHTQEELIRKIDEEYKPALSELLQEAEKLRKEALARSNNNAYTNEQRRAFATNAQSNALTIQVANLYVELLDSQKAGTLESIKSLRLNRDLAENTYRTVRSSVELRGLINSGLRVFDAIGALKMPELKIFEGGALRKEFEEINRRLKK